VSKYDTADAGLAAMRKVAVHDRLMEALSLCAAQLDSLYQDSRGIDTDVEEALHAARAILLDIQHWRPTDRRRPAQEALPLG